MEWLVIYFFVMVERIAALLAIGWLAFWIGAALMGFTILICAMQTDSGYAGSDKVTFTDNIESRWALVSRKVAKWAMIVGMLLGCVSYLIPAQKDLAIIVGSGITYKAVTSETGKRIGGKAVDFLEKKIDEALNDAPLPEVVKPAANAAKQAL